MSNLLRSLISFYFSPSGARLCFGKGWRLQFPLQEPPGPEELSINSHPCNLILQNSLSRTRTAAKWWPEKCLQSPGLSFQERQGCGNRGCSALDTGSRARQTLQEWCCSLGILCLESTRSTTFKFCFSTHPSLAGLMQSLKLEHGQEITYFGISRALVFAGESLPLACQSISLLSHQRHSFLSFS